MSKVNGTIIEISETGGEYCLQAALERQLLPLPGQYLRVNTEPAEELLTATVFPVRAGTETIQFVPFSKQNWHVGQEVAFRGPLGKGFSMPSDAAKVGLIGLTQIEAFCLLPLARWLLENGKEVALATNAQLHGLPMDLEVLPGEQALEVSIWADAAVLAMPREGVAAALVQYSIEYVKKPMEVMILGEFPCGGTASCGVCAVPTKKGWKNACKDGPVFNLAELAAE